MTCPLARRWLTALLTALCLLQAGGVRAQLPAPQPLEPSAEAAAPAATADELEGLLATLQDDAERAELVAKLQLMLEAARGTPEAEAAPQSLSAQLIATLSSRMAVVGLQVAALGTDVADLPAFFSRTVRDFQDPAARERWLTAAAHIVIVIGLALLVRFVVQRLLRPTRTRFAQSTRTRVFGRLLLLAARFILDLVPLVAFAVVVTIAAGLLKPTGMARQVIIVLVNAILAAGLAIALGRALLAPRSPGLRPWPMDSETAEYLFVWIKRLTYTAAIGLAVAHTLFAMGMSRAARNAILDLVGLLLAGMAVILVLQNRTAIGWAIAGPHRPGALAAVRRSLGEIWHILAILYIIALFLVWALGVQGGFGYLAQATALTAVIALLAWLVGGAIGRLLQSGFAIKPSAKARFPYLEERANRYLPILLRIVQIGIGVMAVLGILQVWGIASFAWLSTDLGRRIVGSLLSIAFVIVAALVSWEIVSMVIERQLNRRDAQGNLVQRSARVRTLLPLLRNAALVVLSTIVVLIVLSELGMDIAPLLAGAGVVGLAIGFGAQTLVKDVITGLFILFEDTISVGDVVDVGGGHSGLVEGMTIRTLRMRDGNGSIHTLPFSEVTSITNMTRDFSYFVFDINVSYREDVDQVMQVVRDIGAELQADPAFAPLILEPLEMIGLDGFKESAVNIKARFKTKPIQQWTIGREFNRRMKRRFDELGIEMPFPHVRLYFGADKQGHATPGQLTVTTPDLAQAMRGAPAGAGPADQPAAPAETDRVNLPVAGS